jgi:hypothetical protein
LQYRLTPAQVQALELPSYDIAWAESKMKKAALKLEKLDTDLKNYKANSIKESIRRGHDDLGDHYLDYGDMSNALKCYSRARDYCTSSKHVIHMCLNVIKVVFLSTLSSNSHVNFIHVMCRLVFIFRTGHMFLVMSIKQSQHRISPR